MVFPPKPEREEGMTAKEARELDRGDVIKGHDKYFWVISQDRKRDSGILMLEITRNLLHEHPTKMAEFEKIP